MVRSFGVALLAAVASARDFPDGYVAVPGCSGCLMHSSCIKSMPNGAVVDESTDMQCSYDVLESNEQVYAMDVHTDGSVNFTQMNSSWTIPALPKTEHQTVFFWPGFKAQHPEPGYPVLQPVLQYGQRPFQTDWELQSWFVWAKKFPFGVSATGPRIKVSAGDHITSWMDFDSSTKIWTVYARNDATGEESTVKVSDTKTGKMDFPYAMHVLETIMDSSNYCNLYPPDGKIEFTQISANNGAEVQWIPRTGKTDCQQKITSSPKGDDVKFTWVPGQESVVV